MKKLCAISSALVLSLLMTAPVMAQEDVLAPRSAELIEEGVQNESGGVLLIDGDPNTPQTVQQPDAIGLYRLYNENSGEHFYTADINEANTLISYGWLPEGIGWYAPKSSQYPVYRLYNPVAGDHHYTRDPMERSALIQMGWKDEDIAWYSAGPDGKAVYRQYNPYAETGSHNYTLDANENQELIKIGWVGEDIGWYAVNAACPPENNIRELESLVKQYQALLNVDRSSNGALDGLRDQGMRIASILGSFSNQFDNRYFVFQNGKLVGNSDPGQNSITLQGVGAGDVMIIQPKEKKVQLASQIADGKLQGQGIFFRTTGGSTKVQAASGNIGNGALQGEVASYVYMEEPENDYEEYSSGPAYDNLMNGVIRKHTHYFRTSSARLKEFDWTLEVEKGKAKYEKIGDYYYVCRTPAVNVYYSYIPENLSFWPIGG